VASLDECVRDADVVITIVQDTPDVLELALGDKGILALLSPGAIYVDMSTIRPDGARQVADAAAARSIGFLDAPVSGGEAGAREGKLSIMVGGPQPVFDQARGVLEAMGATIVRVGAAGSGQVVKAANQLMVAGHLQMLAEATVFLEAHDVNLEQALAVIGGGLAGSTVLARKSAGVLAGDYTPGFRVELHDKDLKIVADAAHALDLSLPANAVVTSQLSLAKRRGDGGLDHSALVKLARELNAAQ